MKRSQSKKPTDPHFWSMVRIKLYCSLGAHHVAAGTWVRQRRGDHMRAASCETCLMNQYGITRPSRPFTMTDDHEDVRARQTGDDE
jgi:hypothetical protein